MLKEADLKLAAIAQITIMDAQNLVDELERLRCAYAKQIGALSLILKAFSDLYLELTDKKTERQWLNKQIWRAEKEANMQRIPAWFWRIDRELPLDDQLYRRAKWLLREKPGIHLDDLWDSLTEVSNYSNLSITETELQSIIERAINACTS
jgi:hypothetical protein